MISGTMNAVTVSENFTLACAFLFVAPLDGVTVLFDENVLPTVEEPSVTVSGAALDPADEYEGTFIIGRLSLPSTVLKLLKFVDVSGKGG